MNVYVITDEFNDRIFCIVDDETLCSYQFRKEFGEEMEDEIEGYYLETGKVVTTIKDVPRKDVMCLQGKREDYYIDRYKLNLL